MGTHKQIKETQMNTQNTNLHKKAHSAQPGCMNWSWQLCTWKTSNVQPKCQGPLQLLSRPFLVTSTTKHMRPNGKEGGRSMTNLVTYGMEVVYSAVSDSRLTLHDTVKPTHQMCMKFYEMHVGCNPRTNRLDVE